MRTIHLYGELAEKYGESYRMAVDTPFEAVHAIGTQVPGFTQTIAAGHFRVVRGELDTGIELTEDMLDIGLGQSDLHIVPVVAGAGGIGKALAGVAMAAGSFVAAPLLGPFAGSMLMMGVGMAAGGVAQIISPQADGSMIQQPESGIFSGSIDTATEGSIVPLAYGHVLIRNPLPVSASITAADYTGT